MQAKQEADGFQKRLTDQEQKLSELTNTTRQLEAAAVAAKKGAEDAGAEYAEHANRNSALLAEQQDLQTALSKKSDAVQAQVFLKLFCIHLSCMEPPASDAVS